MVPLVLAVVASCSLAADTALAQSAPLDISGRVQKVRADDTTGVRGVFVVLHRLGMREQGPMDSMATDARGRFRFHIAAPDSQTLYVVSTRYAGIGYFGEPVRGRDRAPVDAALTVYDTATSGTPFETTLRHLVVGPPGPGGARRLLDIVQVVNPDPATRIAADSLAPLWSTRIPTGVLDPQVGEGEVGPDAARFSGDTVFISAPFPPGAKQIVLTYGLPAGARSVRLPVAQATGDVEILVDDSTAVAGGDLHEEPPLALEGRNFRRFVARDVEAGAVLEVGFGGRSRFPVRTVAIMLAAVGLVGGLAMALRPRPGVPASAAAPVHEDANALLGRLVALDERYADRQAHTPPAEWAEYQATRADLKARLARRVAPPGT